MPIKDRDRRLASNREHYHRTHPDATYVRLVDRLGKDHPNWKGGRMVSHGYIFILRKGHRYADRDGYVQEHRIVYEEFNECCLPSYTIIHHINGVKTDNRIENLKPIFRNKHSKMHLSGVPKVDMDERCCKRCGSNKTWMRKYPSGLVRPYWRFFEDGFLCNKCAWVILG